jgi:hypothetical protein
MCRRVPALFLFFFFSVGFAMVRTRGRASSSLTETVISDWRTYTSSLLPICVSAALFLCTCACVPLASGSTDSTSCRTKRCISPLAPDAHALRYRLWAARLGDEQPWCSCAFLRLLSPERMFCATLLCTRSGRFEQIDGGSRRLHVVGGPGLRPFRGCAVNPSFLSWSAITLAFLFGFFVWMRGLMVQRCVRLKS